MKTLLVELTKFEESLTEIKSGKTRGVYIETVFSSEVGAVTLVKHKTIIIIIFDYKKTPER